MASKQRRLASAAGTSTPAWQLVGLDQLLVDIEVETPESFAHDLGIPPGESVQLDEAHYQKVVQEIDRAGLACRYVAGGTVANTLNNYTFLASEPALLLGAIQRDIKPGGPAFAYVAQTPRAVDLSHVRAVEGTIGTAITFIFPDGERSFAVAPGVSNTYDATDLPEADIRTAAAVLTTLYTVSNPDWPIARATRRLLDIAKENDVPVAFGLGTAGLVRRMRNEVRELLRSHVTIAAMNAREAAALTEIDDPLLACQQILDWVDIVIVTQGAEGMTIGGYTDEPYRRATRQPLRSGAIADYNRWEFSRLLRREDCAQPLKIYTHIHPYRGGPEALANCSGAGDAALAAVLHDIAANRFHRATLPNSAKHTAGIPFLSYSSLSRNAQYGNRVAYEVLCGASPRLDGPVGRDRARPTPED